MTTATRGLPREALTIFNTLLGHLEEEAKSLARLAELLDSERDVLRSLRAPGLGDVNREKERVLELIDRVASARAGSVEELTEHLGMTGTRPSLARLLERLPTVERRCLSDARDRLLHVAEMVRKRGEISERLLSVSLDTIHGVLRLLQQEAVAQTQVYGDAGAVAAQGTGIVFQHTA
jgi:flagellar biosynthesis/type III secretory pathway chaperone